MFITFEGGEGSGKSTQSKLLYDRLLNEKYDVLLTREPGGTEESLKIRELLLTGNVDKWDPISESLLYLADRANHWKKVIKPALEAGKIVICDRFQDSTIVYQGYCKKVSINFLNYIYKYITEKTFPNRTYLITISPSIGLRRSFSRINNKETRFEIMDIEFHNKINEAYNNLALKNKNFVKIDGNRDILAIHEDIYKDISLFLSQN